jgi:hypothetical protein
LAGGFERQIGELFAGAKAPYGGTYTERTELLAFCVALAAARGAGGIEMMPRGTFDRTARNVLEQYGLSALP